jgi:hypothetical protein
MSAEVDVSGAVMRSDRAKGTAGAPVRSPYVVSPTYDWLFFLLPPSFALLAGIAISGSAFSNGVFMVRDVETTWAELSLGVLVHAHLVAVFYRSHGNAEIFRLHPIRFLVVPVALFLAILGSAWVAVTSTVVATFWDVWHSGAQTFGFARIYDRNAGVPPDVGRRLDHVLNQLLYLGPILAGATLMDHVDSFAAFDDVGSVFFSSIPARVEGNARYLTWVVLGGGSIFLVHYVRENLRLARRGQGPSRLKVFLLVTTGACSIYSWGFNTWGEAFFIMNLFHAVQYLALVWNTEGRRLKRTLEIRGGSAARRLALLAFFVPIGAYGLVVMVADPELEVIWALSMVVSLMHFWYDAFIWSVQKKQV